MQPDRDNVKTAQRCLCDAMAALREADARFERLDLALRADLVDHKKSVNKIRAALQRTVSHALGSLVSLDMWELGVSASVTQQHLADTQPLSMPYEPEPIVAPSVLPKMTLDELRRWHEETDDGK